MKRETVDRICDDVLEFKRILDEKKESIDDLTQNPNQLIIPLVTHLIESERKRNQIEKKMLQMTLSAAYYSAIAVLVALAVFAYSASVPFHFILAILIVLVILVIWDVIEMNKINRLFQNNSH